MNMGILTQNLDITFGKLKNKIQYLRGSETTMFRLNKKHLCEYYGITGDFDYHSTYRTKACDVLTAAFNSMDVDDVLPDRIVRVLNGYGIACDAVVLRAQYGVTGPSNAVAFILYKRRPHNNQFGEIGYIEAVLGKQHYELWNSIIRTWASNEPASISSIFRAKWKIQKPATTRFIPLTYKHYATCRY